MQRIEGILRVIAQDSHSPARVQTAEDSVAKLSAQLIELQQSEAALEGQVGSNIAICSGLIALVWSVAPTQSLIQLDILAMNRHHLT